MNRVIISLKPSPRSRNRTPPTQKPLCLPPHPCVSHQPQGWQLSWLPTPNFFFFCFWTCIDGVILHFLFSICLLLLNNSLARIILVLYSYSSSNFCYCIVSPYINGLQFLYPFCVWRIFVLLPDGNCHRKYFYERSCTCISTGDIPMT